MGFSGIVRVYATLNYDKNRIPFVPVVMQHFDPVCHGKKKGFKKVIFTYLKPVFIPRKWLKHHDNGGKIIARKFGQKELAPNPLLKALESKEIMKK